MVDGFIRSPNLVSLPPRAIRPPRLKDTSFNRFLPSIIPCSHFFSLLFLATLQLLPALFTSRLTKMALATWFLHFLHSQFFITPPPPSKDFTGQTIIVTGSNTGLGLEAARHLSHLNASLIILAVRNVSKGEAAKASILSTSHRPKSSIEVWSLDMTSTHSIKKFAERASKLNRLDGVVENAGMMTMEFKLVEGYESMVMTNVIGTFYLALLILPILRVSGEKWKSRPRLSIVASEAHNLARFKERKSEGIFEAMNNPLSKVGFERYVILPTWSKLRSGRSG